MTWEGRFTFEVSSAAPDATPVWVDFTSRIRDAVAPMDLGIGRQDNLDQSLPAALTLVLENVDDALTYGNTTSPYPWWAPGLRCRLRETIAGVVMDRFTGFTQVPVEALAAAGLEQRITLTAVDRLGAMQNGRPFVSTLAEYIRYNGGSSLVHYWPLSGSQARFLSVVSSDVLAASVTGGGSNVAAFLAPGFGDSVVSDDLSTSTFTVTYTAGSPNPGVFLAVTFATPITLSTGDTVTVAFWAKPVAVDTNNPLSTVVLLQGGPVATPTDEIAVGSEPPALGGQWQGSFALNTGAWGSSPAVGMTAPGAWTLVTSQLTLGQPALMFANDAQGTAAALGVLPASATYDRLTIGVDYFGSLGHIQVYVNRAGGAAAPTFARHRAQWQMGLSGLERQSTGDRIRTAAQYAGIPNAEFANTIDPGSSVMQRAQMAGKTALDLMREAETTEQGLLYVDGSGNLCFADRRTIYNI